MQIAVGRGCNHYAPMLADGCHPTTDSDLPHEALGTALLRGGRDVETFQSIRCGAMVLSDLGNSPRLIAEAANYFWVSYRVAHIARLGLEADSHADFWVALLSLLPDEHMPEEDAFLPGLSRVVSETGKTGPGRTPLRLWLRTGHVS